MKLEHIAIWVDDIENIRHFYLTYFDVTCGKKYVNPTKNYTSYFLTFNEGDSRIELMHRPDISDGLLKRGLSKGLAHISITVGNKEIVNQMTERFRKDGYTIIGEPRTSGDGYYESVIEDPEGNWIELLGV